MSLVQITGRHLKNGVVKRDGRIVSIKMESGKIFENLGHIPQLVILNIVQNVFFLCVAYSAGRLLVGA